MSKLLSSKEIQRLNLHFQEALLASEEVAVQKPSLFQRLARDSTAEFEVLRKQQRLVLDAVNLLASGLDESALQELKQEQDEYRGELDRRLTRQLSEMQTLLSQHTEQLAVLESVTKGLEHIASMLGASNSDEEQGEGEHRRSSDRVAIPDLRYLLLENRFRGSEENLRTRVADYADLLGERLPAEDTSKRILDIGCGRGELLEVLSKSGIPAYGVDLDEAMAKRAQQKGLEVIVGDALEHLEGLADYSLAAVVALQVVEHLPIKVLRRLLSLCRKKVAVGGLVAFETINTKSLLALAHNYFRDPTHVWPMHPDTLKYEMELAGIAKVEIIGRSPFPEAVHFPKMPEPNSPEADVDAEQDVSEKFNNLSARLDELFFGDQDYCILGRTRANPDLL